MHVIAMAFLLGTSSVSVGQTTAALYDAQAASPAPDPSSVAGGDWQIAQDAGTVTRGPVIDQGLNAWSVTDDALTELLWYNDPLTSGRRDDLSSNGWSITMEARMTSTAPGSSGLGFWYTDNSLNRYLAYFNIDPAGELQIRAQTSAGPSGALFASGVVPAGTATDSYHTLTILNTDGVGDAEVYFDGSIVTFDSGESSISPRFDGTTGVQGAVFGALFAGSTVSGNIRRVELLELPTPSTIGVFIVGGLVCDRRRRMKA